MKYITLLLTILSFSLFSIMSTDLLTHGNHWGILQVLLYVSVALSAFGSGYAHLSFLRMFRIRNRR